VKCLKCEHPALKGSNYCNDHMPRSAKGVRRRGVATKRAKKASKRKR
jgi:hypothetical protein